MALCPLRTTFPIQSIAKTYATHATPKELSGKNQFLSLEHFLVRSKVISLWRNIARTIYQIPPSSAQRAELRTFARTEFERNRHVEDLAHIRYLVSKGKTEFDSMKPYVARSGK
nr:lyr motif-containing protein 2 [Quercus suber]